MMYTLVNREGTVRKDFSAPYTYPGIAGEFVRVTTFVRDEVGTSWEYAPSKARRMWIALVQHEGYTRVV